MTTRTFALLGQGVRQFQDVGLFVFSINGFFRGHNYLVIWGQTMVSPSFEGAI